MIGIITNTTIPPPDEDDKDDEDDDALITTNITAMEKLCTCRLTYHVLISSIHLGRRVETIYFLHPLRKAG